MSLHTKRIAACMLLDRDLAAHGIPSRVDVTRRCVRVERCGRPVVRVWPLLHVDEWGDPSYLVEIGGERRQVGPVGLLREVR